MAVSVSTFFCNPMGNSLEVYRSAIGMFYNCSRISCKCVLVQADSYRNMLLTNLRCSLLIVSLLVLQRLNRNVNVVFLLFVLHFILMIGSVELNPDPETDLLRSPPNLVNSANDNSIFRNKTNFVQHFADEFDILVITESHLDNSIQNDDIELYSFTKNIQRRDRQNQTEGGLLIYTKENVNISRIIQLENNLISHTGILMTFYLSIILDLQNFFH